MGFFLVGIFSGSCESRNSSSRMYPLVQSVNSDIPAFGGLLVFSSLCKIGIIAPSFTSGKSSFMACSAGVRSESLETKIHCID